MSHRRTFGTTYCSLDEPDWAPLEALSALARSSPDLPSFHPGEFMWMCSVENKRKRLVIHLYKHIDTRYYINLDAAGHAYEFRYDPELDDDDRRGDSQFSGRYRLHRSVDEAIWRLRLWEFEHGLFRSFPPSEWASDVSVGES